MWYFGNTLIHTRSRSSWKATLASPDKSQHLSCLTGRVRRSCDAKRTEIMLCWWPLWSKRDADEAKVAPIMGSGEVSVCRENGVRRPVLSWYVLQLTGFSHHKDISHLIYSTYKEDKIINYVLSMRFAKIGLMLQETVWLLNTKKFIAANADGSYFWLLIVYYE